ncbi:MAG: hypothetical protein Q9174_003789 [Haloplaca sp. 1 TL-2023]
MKETIAAARENHDIPCLNYSLSWLYQFGQAHPEEMTEIQKKGVLGSEKEAIAFLKARTKESNMWTLLSTTLLSEAKLILTKGESVSQAFESVVKASHINVTRGILEACGRQLVMQSTMYDRLGVGCQARTYSELFLLCYTSHTPSEDVIQSQCGSAHKMSRIGQYEEALMRMEEIDQEALRTLRYQQHWITNLGILKLRKHFHKDELDECELLLSQLKAAPFETPDSQFDVSVLEVHIRIRRREYSGALALLEKILAGLDKQEADIFQRLKMMILKARIYDHAGMPQKGFSIVLRAASLAHKALLLPVLWEAVGTICRILVSVKEFDAAVKLLEGILPQATECEDCELAAYLFSCLADGHMGYAGQAKEGSLPQKERLTKTLEALERAFEEYSKIEDIRGQCEMLAKKATIMHLNGDTVLANDVAAQYLDIKEAANVKQ